MKQPKQKMNEKIYVAKISSTTKTYLETTFGDDWEIDFVEVSGDIYINEQDANDMLNDTEYLVIEWTFGIGSPVPRKHRKN